MDKQRPQTLNEARAELGEALHTLWAEIVKAAKIEAILRWIAKRLDRNNDNNSN